MVYVKIEKRTKIQRPQVKLEDFAQIHCKETDMKKACEKLNFFRVPPQMEMSQKRYVFSVLKVVALIEETFADVEVICLGETDFILDYSPKEPDHPVWEMVKVIGVAATVFVGGAFAIMTFNNDGDVLNVFSRLYELITGMESDGRTLLELGYAIGVPVGIIVFFNHFSGKHFTKDPTPIEVEMRIYEEDVDTTLIKNASRQGREAE